MMPFWVDIAMSVVLVAGASFALVGAIGLAKLGDFMKRIHGPTKASTLGVGSVLVASILYFSFAKGQISLHELLITAFVFITAPVSAHMLVRALLNRNRVERPAPPPGR